MSKLCIGTLVRRLSSLASCKVKSICRATEFVYKGSLIFRYSCELSKLQLSFFMYESGQRQRMRLRLARVKRPELVGNV